MVTSELRTLGITPEHVEKLDETIEMARLKIVRNGKHEKDRWVDSLVWVRSLTPFNCVSASYLRSPQD